MAAMEAPGPKSGWKRHSDCKNPRINPEAWALWVLAVDIVSWAVQFVCSDDKIFGNRALRTFLARPPKGGRDDRCVWRSR